MDIQAVSGEENRFVLGVDWTIRDWLGMGMIAGVIQVKDEIDIIDCTVGHMLAQGVDHIWAMDWESSDGTREALEAFADVTVMDGSPLPFYWAHQGNYNTRLGNMAHSCGADWIIPFDADEYWTGTHGRTVKEALESVTADRVQAQILQYADFDHRSLREYPWTKVAYRYRDDAVIVAGNHFVTGGIGPADEDALTVHELKFRDFAQFERKIRRRVPWDENNNGQPGAPGDSPGMVIGGTQTVYADQFTPTELADHWLWLQSETEACSIPSEFRP